MAKNKYVIKPIRRPESPKKAMNLESVIKAEMKSVSVKPQRLISPKFVLKISLIFLKLNPGNKYPQSQLPKIINSQNFGELKGSCKAGLK